MELFATIIASDIVHWIIYAIGGMLIVAASPYLLGVRYIPHNRVGIIEKFWSPLGPTGDPARRCLRDQSRLVHGHH